MMMSNVYIDDCDCECDQLPAVQRIHLCETPWVSIPHRYSKGGNPCSKQIYQVQGSQFTIIRDRGLVKNKIFCVTGTG